MKMVIMFFLALCTHYKVYAQISNGATVQKKLHTYLAVLQANKNFSGEILVAKGDSILFHEAIGWASREQRVPLKIGGKYRIASITKTFTATLVALAYEEEKLAFHDKTSRYIAGLSDALQDITIHQLLTHTSGLPHNEGVREYWEVKSKLQMSTEQVLAEINAVDLLFKPGTQMHYSSLGYYLLATVLENVYGDTYSNIVQKRIFEKLQMESSGTANTLAIVPAMASGYHAVTDDSLVVAPYRNYSMLKGAGDMYSTAMDILAWNRSFLSGALVQRNTRELLFTPYAIDSSKRATSYGYGWFLRKEKPGKYFHGGGTWGYSSYTALYPDDSISIIVVSNISTLPTEAIGNDMEAMVFGLPFTMPKEEIQARQLAIDLLVYSGTFVSEKGAMQLVITTRADKLFAQLGNNPAFEIYAKGQHQFFGKKVDVQFSFNIHNGVAREVTAERMGQTFRFTKQ